MKPFGLLELHSVLGAKTFWLFITGCALFSIACASLFVTALVLLSRIS